MEHTSDLVYEGKLIHEESYPQRSAKYEEVQIGGIKVDYYDAKNKIIHEVKKSDKIEDAHIWQLKYYLYVFEKAGINGVTGILEYPKLRHTDEVILSNRDIMEIEEIKKKIEQIVNGKPSEIKKMKICKRCAYYDFCFVGEGGED